MFLGTATIESKTKDCLVKFVYGWYATNVHHLLARDGFAPDRFGIRTKEGAPTAIAMEYLKPYSPGSEGCATLFDLAKRLSAPDEQESLARAPGKIVGEMAEANLVHEDLRANKLIVHVNADGSLLDGEDMQVKAIDFDWNGESGKVTYPQWRNPELRWPSENGENVVVGHDQTLVEGWWGIPFPGQVYPPGV